jgi:hypothetical protein
MRHVPGVATRESLFKGQKKDLILTVTAISTVVILTLIY